MVEPSVPVFAAHLRCIGLVLPAGELRLRIAGAGVDDRRCSGSEPLRVHPEHVRKASTWCFRVDKNVVNLLHRPGSEPNEPYSFSTCTRHDRSAIAALQRRELLAEPMLHRVTAAVNAGSDVRTWISALQQPRRVALNFPFGANARAGAQNRVWPSSSSRIPAISLSPEKSNLPGAVSWKFQNICLNRIQAHGVGLAQSICASIARVRVVNRAGDDLEWLAVELEVVAVRAQHVRSGLVRLAM